MQAGFKSGLQATLPTTDTQISTSVMVNPGQQEAFMHGASWTNPSSRRNSCMTQTLYLPDRAQRQGPLDVSLPKMF